MPHLNILRFKIRFSELIKLAHNLPTLMNSKK